MGDVRDDDSDSEDVTERGALELDAEEGNLGSYRPTPEQIIATMRANGLSDPDRE